MSISRFVSLLCIGILTQLGCSGGGGDGDKPDGGNPKEAPSDVDRSTEGEQTDDNVSTDSTGGDTGDDSEDLSPVNVTLRGAVDKGPFVLGSSVAISPVDRETGSPTGQVFNTQTTSDLGEFEVEFEYRGLVSLEANGFYYNEATGALSNAPITLRAYYEVTEGGSQSAYINLFTHLTYNRIKTLIAAGASFDTALAQAETELRRALEIGPPDFDPGATGIEMNVTGGESLANAYLFAVSAVLAERATLDGGPIDAALQELLNSIAVDFAKDGDIDQRTKDEIWEAQFSLDVERVMGMLANRLQDVGSNAGVPDINLVLDLDRDGAVNRHDCLIYDPLRYDGHADLDGDGFDHYRCGGEDLDDDCATCVPGGVPACGEARDHDEDGVVDELGGCGACVPGTPEIVSTVSGDFRDVFAVGNILYALSNELVVIDAATPSKLTETARYSDIFADTLSVYGDIAYLAGPDGMVLVDISDPSAMATLSFAGAPAGDLVVSGGFVMTDGPGFVDVSNPYMPMGVGMDSGMPGGDPEWMGRGAVFRKGNLLMAADESGMLSIYDISGEEGPMPRGSASLYDGMDFSITSDPNGDASDIPMGDGADMGAALFVTGDRLFFAGALGLVAVDLSNPDAPERLGWSEDLAWLKDVFVVDDTAYVVGPQGLFALDVSQPAAPRITAGPIGEGLDLRSVFIVGDTAYAGGAGGLIAVSLDCGGEEMVRCGNARRDFGEGCDQQDFGGESCASFGYDVGALSCTETCDIDRSACTNCGNNRVDFNDFVNPDMNPDGVKDGMEECDGSDLNGMMCQSVGFGDGHLLCGDDCRFDTSDCFYICGDWRLDPGEECERNWDPWGEDDLDGHTCVDFGFANETGLRCTDTCGFDPSGCLPVCGNDLFEPGEACEGDNLDGKTCADFGFVAADGLACTQCEFDFAGCTAACGNDVIEPVEDCEGDDLGGATCQALGYAAPDGLACGETCLFDDSGCTAVCGNGVVEPGEACDDGDEDDEDGCSSACEVEDGWQCLGTPSVCHACGPYHHGETCDQCVVLVDPDRADGAEDGMTWRTAYRNLDDAIDQLKALAEPCEVWVADGTVSLYTTSPDASLHLPSGAALYGGFAGTESSRDLRDLETHETVLSGKGPGAAHLRAIIRVADADAVRVDGFTITGGLADGGDGGSGAHVMESEVTFAHCVFKGNGGNGDGGALYASNSTVHLVDTRFEENEASRGGAVFVGWSTLVLDGVTFTLNNASDAGGALFLSDHTAATVTDSTFETNHAFNGGAVASDWGARLEVARSVFTDNRSEDLGGAVTAMWETRQSYENTVFIGNQSRRGGAFGSQGENTIELVNCTVAGNTGWDSGGGFGGDEASRIMVTNSIIFNNDPSAAGSQMTLTVQYSDVQGGMAGEGNLNADPEFADLENGDVHLGAGSPAIDAALGDRAPSNDLFGYPRYDDPETENRGAGRVPYADMGAVEFHTCGNGALEGNEMCEGDDLGGAADCRDIGFIASGPLSCTAHCTFDLKGCEAVCGNDALEPSEACEAGNLNGNTCLDLGFESEDGLACGDDCQFDISGCTSTCGNEVIEPTEQCEGFDLNGESCETLGFNDGMLSCTEECTFNTSGCNNGCGNDRWEGWYNDQGDREGEECDGTDLGGMGCESLGLCGEMACNDDCTFNAEGCYECCGNGNIDMNEECDGDNMMGWDCSSFGFSGGTLSCGDDCRFDTSACFYVCGNGWREGDEACDGYDVPASCEDQGYTGGGDLRCKEDCTFDETGCNTICGNDVLEPGEVCEGDDLDGNTCEDLGFVGGGTLTCSGCALDTESCLSECGNSVIEPDEQCEAGDLDGVTCADFGFASPDGLVCTGCAFDATGCVSECGNGVIEPGETCDDGNDTPDDGCSDGCIVDEGWQCLGEPSRCDACDPFLHGADCDACIVLVDNDPEIGERDGATWQTALESIQEGLDLAEGLDARCAVWVKAGTHYVYETNNNDHIALRPDMRLFGGFDGTERYADERNLAANRTVVSGFDGPERLNRVNHVFDGDNARNILIDGFKIIGTGEWEWGSAIRVNWGNAVLRNTWFKNGRPRYIGNAGGVYGWNADLELTSCIVEGFDGAGVVLDWASAEVIHSTFFNNGPAGISLFSNADVRVVGSIIFGNDPEGIDGDGDAEVVYSLVQGYGAGGGNLSGDPMFVDARAGDFHLMPESPVIDAADGDTAPALDMNGFVRFDSDAQENIGTGEPDYADMGALEWTPCGNGQLDDGEACDGALMNAADCTDIGYAEAGILSCLATCRLATGGCRAVCNNDLIEPGEACDGALLNDATCQDIGYAEAGTLACDPVTCGYDESGCAAVCGNDVVEPGEQCEGDDLDGARCDTVGFGGGALGCNADCTFDFDACTEGCGNNQVEMNEQCDGTDFNGSMCQYFEDFSAGELRCNDDCTIDTSECGYQCGNGWVEPGEACDMGALDGKNCTHMGFASAGNLFCTESCEFDLSGCTAVCGNALLEPTEACETGDLGGADCTTLGYVSPDGLACSGCRLDDSGCTAVCGNDVLEPTEDCDGENLGGADCTDLGYADAGALACDACGFDVSGCAADCGNGLVEPGEGCDDGNRAPSDGCSDACQIEEGFQCLGSPSRCDACPDFFHGSFCDQCIVLVDQDASITTRDGKGWRTAFPTIKEGIAEAMSIEGPCQVWVAGGTYYQLEQSTNDRIDLESGISLYGGFAGTESALDQRVLGASETILDGRADSTSSLKVATLMRAEWVADVAVDGFTFRNAGQWDWGGGIRMSNAWMRVSNCTFDRISRPEGNAGAIYVWQSTATIENCVVTNCRGNGVMNDAGDLTIISSTIAGNDPFGITNDNNGTTTINSSIIWANPQGGVDQRSGMVTARHSDIQNWGTLNGNINMAPLFVDLESGDVRLSEGSPCIDNADGDIAPAFDRLGLPRFDDPTVTGNGAGDPAYADMGAFEVSGCGNGTVDPGEACDGVVGEATCEDAGYAEPGVVTCLSTCRLDTALCRSACGNTVLEPGEQCEAGQLGGATCQDVGYVEEGGLACNAETCAFDDTGCEAVCGNGKREPGEACDGDDWGLSTCEDHGFEWGNLSCNGDCTFNFSDCWNGCGNGRLEGGEQCDGDMLTADCGAQGLCGELSCSDTCEHDFSSCTPCI